MTPQIAYALVVFLLIWVSITYSLPLAQSIVELLRELEKYAIVRKDTSLPVKELEWRSLS